MRFCLICFFLSFSLMAQPSSDNDFSLSVGFGVLVNQEAYRDVDTEYPAIPLVDLRWKRLYVRGINIGYEWFRGDRNKAALTLRPQFTDLDEDDSPYFAGMEDRDLAAMLGLDWDIDLGNRFSLELTGEADVTGRNEGAVGSVKLSRVFIHKRKTLIIPELSLQYNDQNFNDYYYGVRLSEALANRPFYEPDGGINTQVSLLVRHDFTDKFSFLTILSSEWLGSEITDSPLVDQDYSTTLITGVTWKIK